eukprot:COSAG06_NODE_53461_length_300_cov_0.502488_2_plen_25_part_01
MGGGGGEPGAFEGGVAHQLIPADRF